MPDGLRLVVGGQGQDQPHHRLEVSLQDLSGGDGVHLDPLGYHELEDPLQVLPHALEALWVVLDPRHLLASCIKTRVGFFLEHILQTFSTTGELWRSTYMYFAIIFSTTHRLRTSVSDKVLT